MTMNGLLKSMLTSFIEKLMSISPTLKSCINDAKSNVQRDNPFTVVVSTKEDPSNLPDKDYGILKAPVKKHYIN